MTARQNMTWKQIRQSVSTINPILSQLIDECDPPATYSFYKADYSYAEMIQLKEFPVFAGIVLQNSAEIFYEGFGKIIPRCVLKAGDVFGFDHLMSDQSASILNLCQMSAGIRNIVMVPAIGDVESHKNLVRDFGVNNKPPNALHDQWYIFKNIAKTQAESWRCQLLFFSEFWYQAIKNDPAWRRLKTYVMAKKTRYVNYYQHLWLMKTAFYHVLKKRNFKADPFCVDTALHLFAIACGIEFGFKFTNDNSFAPISLIQQAYINSYKLKYYPLMMCPSLYESNKTNHPIYYSLQYPTCSALSPRLRRTSHVIENLAEIKDIINAFHSEIKQVDIGYPLINKMASNIKFDCFHTQSDKSKQVLSTSEILLLHKLIQQDNFLFDENKFPATGPMLRGCVAIYE